ncbi:MAG: phosphomannomutase/phosphoglucomutase [Candidatus Babeliaceae bacterium]|jgi:phosphomannomutase/phosphoglucomutase
MKSSIFRKYDIRGKINEDFILEEAYALGQSIALYFLQQLPICKKVVVGMDGRSHSEIIKNHLIQALSDSGLDVVFIGVSPTPVMYFMMHTQAYDAGIMITASHNGPEYNGLKICLGKESLSEEALQDIYRLYLNQSKIISNIAGVVSVIDANGLYVNWLVEHFAHLKNITISVAFDCANGTAGAIVPDLISAFGWHGTHRLYEDVVAVPVHPADPVIEENMRDLRQHVVIHKLELGIGFDGDCDRMAAITASGKLILGDILLAVFSKDVLKYYNNAAVVYDIKCSQIVPDLLIQWGGIPYVSPSGHSLIKKGMQKYKALLAGELSGHFFFNDRYFGYDDGIYAALRLIDIMHSTGLSLDEMVSEFPAIYATDEIRVSCPEDQKHVVIEACERYYQAKKDAELSFIDGIRIVTPCGWSIIRPSNTQAVISIRCESRHPDLLEQIKYDVCEALKGSLDQDVLYAAFFNTGDGYVAHSN